MQHGDVRLKSTAMSIAMSSCQSETWRPGVEETCDVFLPTDRSPIR